MVIIAVAGPVEQNVRSKPQQLPLQIPGLATHVKIVELPENTSTQIKDPTFGTIGGLSFTVGHFEWTVQKEPEHWEMLEQFPFKQYA